MEFFEDPSTTREEILAAAYRALCRHGYAELTIQKIGDEFDKSPSLVYHHYEGKDELLLACLEYVLERYERQFLEEDLAEPRRRLEEGFEEIFASETAADSLEFVRALVELRGQAPHDERYREHFTRSDRLFQRRLSELIAAGVAAGEFREVDPDATAMLLQTLFVGYFVRLATVEDDAWAEEAARAIEAVVASRLYLESDTT